MIPSLQLSILKAYDNGHQDHELVVEHRITIPTYHVSTIYMQNCRLQVLSQKLVGE
jgi:hypothetical protein